MPGPKLPLLSFELQSPVVIRRDSSPSYPGNDGLSPTDWTETTKKTKQWTAYIPTFFALAFLLGPHISIFHVLFYYHYILKGSVGWFIAHLGITYSLTFTALTAFIIVVVRDPGPVDGVKAQVVEDATRIPPLKAAEVYGEGGDGEEISLAEALAPRDPASTMDTPWRGNGEPRWCQKCWSWKPERCHHCSDCGRCVLKMDHHCPWLASKCVGHRTYAAFVRLLLSVSLLSIHSFAICITPIRHYLGADSIILETDWTPYHVIFVAMLGFVFSLTIGSFYGYHVYLISTNQTTLEHLAPFLLLRHLPSPEASSQLLQPASSRDPAEPDSPYFFPSPPPDRMSFSSSPSASSPLTPQQKSRHQEHLLNSAQRRRVRYAHGKIKMYDLGFARNWDEVFGGGRQGWRWWVNWIVCGGRPKGDGYTFEFSTNARRQLARLASELETL